MNTLAFAARLLARRGALVEESASLLEAVLPRELGAELGLEEHAVLVETPRPGAHHVGYGSALLERLVASAAGAIPFAAARISAAAARGGQALAAAEALAFRNGVFSVAEPVPAVGYRLVAHAVFTLHGDERREGLCAAAASLLTGGVVAGFEDAAAGALEESTAPLVGAERLLASARAAFSACAASASEAAAGFQERMQRRFARDRERLEGYFDELLSELDRRTSRKVANPADPREKRRVLERERSAKLEALAARYVMRLETRPIALLLVEAPTYRMQLVLRRRKTSRSLEVEYDCATRRLVPPVCEACGRPAPRPAACDDAVHLLCEACAPRSEGRIVCGACGARRAPAVRRAGGSRELAMGPVGAVR
jgi:hypothetical protein